MAPQSPLLLIVSRCSWTIWLFRRKLIAEAAARGCRVKAVCGSDPAYDGKLRQAGIEQLTIPLVAGSTNPWRELQAFLALWRLFRRQRPDIVHNFTIKPVLYGGLAARLAGVPAVVSTVTGLGHVFVAKGWKASLLRRLVEIGYRVVFAPARARVIFQNSDDQAQFQRNRLVAKEKCLLIKGSGVDTAEFTPRPEAEGPPLVVLAARMLWDKGVGEFVEAAKQLREAGVEARFALVGDTDPQSPAAAVPKEQLAAWQASGAVEWWGYRDDMRAVLAQAHIACLPSYYGEGVPKFLIEAAASGRSIATTDWPGCREIVRHEENGLLVPVRDAAKLAQALRRLIEDPALRQRLGACGRRLAEGEFSDSQVIGGTLAVYAALLENEAAAETGPSPCESGTR